MQPDTKPTTPLLSWRWWRREVAIYLMAAAGAAGAFVAGAWVWSVVR